MALHRNSLAHRIATTARRRRAAERAVAGASQQRIARELGCSQATVSRDLAAVVAEDRSVAREAIRELRARELGTLELMEATATDRFNGAADEDARLRWFAARLKVHERRARLAGLDAPHRHETQVAGPGGGPVQLEVTPVMDELTRIRQMYERLLEQGMTLAAARVGLLSLGVDPEDTNAVHDELALQAPPDDDDEAA